jgi:hypothetical protein
LEDPPGSAGPGLAGRGRAALAATIGGYIEIGAANDAPAGDAAADLHVDAVRGPTTTARSESGPMRSHQVEGGDVLLVDGRLHVMTSGCFVTIRGDDVLVRKGKVELLRAPLAAIEMAYLEGKGIGISADLTMRLCSDGVPVVFAPLVGMPAALAQLVEQQCTPVRQQQVLRRNEPDVVRAGLAMLAAKVANQASVLRYFGRYRNKLADPLGEQLTRCADDLRDKAAEIEQIDAGSADVRVAAGLEWAENVCLALAVTVAQQAPRRRR